MATLTHDFFELRCWNYYLKLEQRMIGTANYVTFSTANYETYSKEFMDSLLLACAEIESLLRTILNDANQGHNIRILTRNVLAVIPELPKIEAYLLENEKIRFKSYADLQLENTKEQLFPWWTSHNDVKHYRLEYEERGSLKNTLHALACLFTLNIACLKRYCEDNHRDSPRVSSKLFCFIGMQWSVNVFSEVRGCPGSQTSPSDFGAL